MTTPPPAADWYRDPSGKPGLMYWDGQQWHPESATDASTAADQPSFQPASTTLRPRGRATLIVALVVTVVVLAGIVGVTGYILLQHNASRSPTAQPAPTSSAAVPSATATPRAQPPELAPFVGQWGGGHSGSLEIHSDGTGRWTYSDVSTCPNAPLAGCGITGTADFTLTSVVNGTATGSVTASSNPKNDPVGGPVTIVLGSGWQGTGVVLAVSIGKMQGWSFCNGTSPPHNCAEQ